MKFSLSLAALSLLAAPGVLAGLETSKFSTVLTPSNFDGVIASQSEGTLVGFGTAWCSFCKSLEPTWTKIAEAFEGDDRCKVAHLDADDPAARPLTSKYGVSGYPTLKFIQPPSKGGAAETYSGPRTEQALLEFLNEKCGTHKLPGGLLGDLAGRIPSLDTLAGLYLTPTATRPALLSSASALASSLGTSTSNSLSSYYLKVFDKFASLDTPESVTAAKEWVEKERLRLGKIASKKGSVAVKKMEEARMKQNILAAFASASASASSLSSQASATASSLSSVASSTLSSAASAASASGSSVVDAANTAAAQGTDSASSIVSAAQASGSSVLEEAQKSAGSAYEAAATAAVQGTQSATSLASEASKSVESVANEAGATVGSATDVVKEQAAKVTGRVKEEL
ncbi:hypothetical protein JCM11641_007014 [Rhodosporidiobolus odoratus]